MAGGGYYLVSCDLVQAFVGMAVMRESGFAIGMAQSDSLCPKWSGTRGISRAKQAYNRNVQSRGEVKRPGISANEQTCATSESDELRDSAGDCKSIVVAGDDERVRQQFFACPGSVDQGLEIMASERLCHQAVANGRPLLGAPACAGIHDDKAGDAQPHDFRIGPGLSSRIVRKLRGKQVEFFLAKVFFQGLGSEAKVLFDNVLAQARKFF